MNYYLFKFFTSSFYGAELWSNGLQILNALQRVSLAYHRAVKKTAGLNVWDSNRVACDMVGVPICKHLQAKRILKYIMSVVLYHIHSDRTTLTSLARDNKQLKNYSQYLKFN